jgi:hypothetical protein
MSLIVVLFNLSVVLSNTARRASDDETVSISNVSDQNASHISSSDSDYEISDTDTSDGKSSTSDSGSESGVIRIQY